MLPGMAGLPLSGTPAGPTVFINPDVAFDNHAGPPFYAERSFSLVSLAGAPTAYVWSIVSGTGTVQSGQGTAAATIRTNGACVIRCATTIGGGDYNPEAAFTYEPGAIQGGGGGFFGGGGFGGGQVQ